MKELAVVFFGTILVDNYILTKFLGVCPFLGVSKKVDSSVGMGLAVIFVMVAATTITYPVYTYLLLPNGLEYLRTIAFILIIALFVQLTEMAVKRYLPGLHSAFGIFLPLIATNCAILGATILNIDEEYGFVTAMVNSFGAGVGFLLALVIFSGIRQVLEKSDVPDAFKGIPVTLISAGIMCVAFVGFGGIVSNIFS